MAYATLSAAARPDRARDYWHKTQGYSMVGSHDTFLLAPNLGESTGLHSNMHDEAIDPKSVFTDFAAVPAQAHENGVYLTAHDAIDPMHDAPTLAAQHAHHFWCERAKAQVFSGCGTRA